MDRRTPRGTLRLLPLLLLFLAVSAGRAEAQVPAGAQPIAPSDTVYEVRLQDGSVLFGRVVSADAQRLVLVTGTGVRVELDRAQIRGATPARGEMRADGAVWLEDPNSTRLFFGPTGRSLRQGEGYVGAFELFLPFLSYGVTDRITIAGGTPIIPEVMGRVFYLAPKVQVVRSERLNVSTGVLAFFDATSDDSDVVGVAYGAGTWGSTDNAITLGAGWGFAGSDVENRPAFMLGAEKRLSSRVKLITENYMISYTENTYSYGGPDREPTVTGSEVRRVGLLGGGIRIFGARMAGDLGAGVWMGENEVVCCVPLVNFVYNFGGSR